MIVNGEPKSQEVRVMLQLTLDVDATLDKKEIEDKLKIVINGYSFSNLISYPDMEFVQSEILQIQEEAEIYGNE